MSVEPLYLIGAVAGRRVALDAALVDSVIDVATVQPVPGAAPGLLGLAALRSRVLTVVDCAVALGVADDTTSGPRPEGAALPTIVLEVDGYLYGFVLDRVDDVVTADRPIAPAGAPLGGRWSAASGGIIEVGGTALPVLEPTAILAAMAAGAGWDGSMPSAVNPSLTRAR